MANLYESKMEKELGQIECKQWFTKQSAISYFLNTASSTSHANSVQNLPMHCLKLDKYINSYCSTFSCPNNHNLINCKLWSIKGYSTGNQSLQWDRGPAICNLYSERSSYSPNPDDKNVSLIGESIGQNPTGVCSKFWQWLPSKGRYVTSILQAEGQTVDMEAEGDLPLTFRINFGLKNTLLESVLSINFLELPYGNFFAFPSKKSNTVMLEKMGICDTYGDESLVQIEGPRFVLPQEDAALVGANVMGIAACPEDLTRENSPVNLSREPVLLASITLNWTDGPTGPELGLSSQSVEGFASGMGSSAHTVSRQDLPLGASPEIEAERGLNAPILEGMDIESPPIVTSNGFMASVGAIHGGFSVYTDHEGNGGNDAPPLDFEGQAQGANPMDPMDLEYGEVQIAEGYLRWDID